MVGRSWFFVCRWAPGHPLLARLRLLRPNCAESGSHAQAAGSAPLWEVWEERRSPWTLGVLLSQRPKVGSSCAAGPYRRRGSSHVGAGLVSGATGQFWHVASRVPRSWRRQLIARATHRSTGSSLRAVSDIVQLPLGACAVSIWECGLLWESASFGTVCRPLAQASFQGTVVLCRDGSHLRKKTATRVTLAVVGCFGRAACVCRTVAEGRESPRVNVGRGTGVTSL